MAIARAAVKLLWPWNGRKVGAIIPQLDARIAADMVEHGRAEYVHEVVGDKVTVVIEDPKPKRKRRKKKADNENVSEPDADTTTTGESC